MIKQVGLAIDRQSWTTTSPEFTHSIPPSFPNATATQVDFLTSLLQVGALTVPRRGAACSLAAYWAYIRYIAAIDYQSPTLRLIPDWSELDSHQKTILSDDWGVGFTTSWLASRLSYTSFCDGRYFIERLKGLGLVTVNRGPEKHGPYKSPDFIFLDTSGLFHIVECKGTQQSVSGLRSAMSDGVAQKRGIAFSDEQTCVAQRIVGGLFIADSDCKGQSVLAFADPAPREGLIVSVQNSSHPDIIRDQVHRGDLAIQLQLVGAQFLADELQRLPAQTEDAQQERRNHIAGAVRQFIVSRGPQISDGWLSRTIEIPFPEVLSIGAARFGSVKISHKIRASFISHMAQYDPSKITLEDQFPTASVEQVAWRSLESDNSAAIYRGSEFASEILLIE
jgi:hypothetical protein